MADITILDNLEPECVAMLQACYSRSHQSINNRIYNIKDLNEIKRTMGKYYVGYGHASIADCGHTTIFIEGVSLLAAKVLQDTPLYSGQETSTRYIDFTSQSWIYSNSKYNESNQKLIDFYSKSKPKLIEYLYKQYPGDLNEQSYIKTINAKAFDILRAWLPGGMITQLSWHTSLRHARERLTHLYHHPLDEIREICKTLIVQLIDKYPNTFSGIWDDIDRLAKFNLKYSSLYYNELDLKNDGFPEFKFTQLCETGYVENIIIRENKKDPIPRGLNLEPDALLEFKLCFASTRDLLRHRNCYLPLPILTKDLGFNQWYINSLPADLQIEAKLLLDNHPNMDELNKYEKQYHIPIGFNVPIIMKSSLPQLLYIIELRSSKTVHPTLRRIVQKIAKKVENYYPDTCNFFCDYDEDDFTLRRGTQDIVQK